MSKCGIGFLGKPRACSERLSTILLVVLGFLPQDQIEIEIPGFRENGHPLRAWGEKAVRLLNHRTYERYMWNHGELHVTVFGTPFSPGS